MDWGLDTACENYRLGGEPDSGGIGPSGSGNEPGTDGDESPKKRPSSTRKYLCPVCGNSVRATKDVNILCMDCNVQMIKVP